MTELQEENQSVEEEPMKKKKKVMPECEQCKNEISKYTCPKCTMKTCSIKCIKQHKIDKNCDGMRPAWAPVERISDYDDQQLIKDKEFLNSVQTIVKGTTSPAVLQPIKCVDFEKADELSKNAEAPSSPHLSVTPTDSELPHSERCLLKSAQQRRIWLKISSPNEASESRHEQFSDTIFWTLTIKFLREVKQSNADGLLEAIIDKEEGASEIEEHFYTVKNIPESLTVLTLLRQFLEPKPFSPVISPSELDSTNIRAFQEAGLEHILLYMKVPVGEKERYYIVDKSKTILENLRNRFVVGHPILIVTLDNEFNQWEMLNETEAKELRESLRLETREKAKLEESSNKKPHGPPKHNRDFKNRGGRNKRNQKNRNNSRGDQIKPVSNDSGFAHQNSQRGRRSAGFMPQNQNERAVGFMPLENQQGMTGIRPTRSQPTAYGYPPQNYGFFGGASQGFYGNLRPPRPDYAQRHHFNQNYRAAQSAWNAAVRYNQPSYPKKNLEQQSTIQNPQAKKPSDPGSNLVADYDSS